MGLIVLDRLEKFYEILQPYVSVCKSDSRICGKELRNAHYKLGIELGNKIAEIYDVKSFAVIVMMRGGLSFGLGIADAIENNPNVVVNISFYDNKSNHMETDFDRYEKIIIVDSVIKTGKSMIGLASKLNNKKVIFATNVIDKSCIERFKDETILAIRISENSFIGSSQKNVVDGKGPDTGERLFNSDFFD